MTALRVKQAACRLCSRRSGCDGVSPSSGPEGARLMAVWDKPGRPDERRMFRKLLDSAGIDASTVFETHAVRCGYPQPKAAELAACKRWLREEIGLIKPIVIVTLGKPPAQLLMKGCGRFDYEKSICRPVKPAYLNGAVVVPLRHPSTLLRGGMYEVRACVVALRKCGRLIESCDT